MQLHGVDRVCARAGGDGTISPTGMLWTSILLTVALVPVSALVWWYRIRLAAEASRPVGIYERVAGLLERQRRPMEDDVRAAVEREADKEFRIALDERGLDPNAYRLVLREDELLDVAPWVIHADGREEPLSAFEAALMRGPAQHERQRAHVDRTNPYSPPSGEDAAPRG